MKSALALLSLSLLLACEPVHVDANTTVEGSLSSVNEGIVVSSDSRVGGRCRSVNGSIRIADRCTTQDLSTVNGSIRVGADCTVNGDISSVNGSVGLAQRTRMDGCIDTVNGKVDLEEARVEHDITTVNGDIFLCASKVEGGIRIKGKQRGLSWGTLVIHLTRGSEVKGDIRVEDPNRKVEVRLEGDSAVRGQVIGAVVKKA